MHPTLAPGAFVFVYHSKHMYQTPKLLSNWWLSYWWLNYFNRFPILASFKGVSVGDIVVVNHSKYGRIIKRITEIYYTNNQITSANSNNANFTRAKKHKSLRLKLCGDNQNHSVSEQAIGWVSAEDVIGKVVYRVQS